MKVLVTGASKGIGKGIATFLGRKGYALGLLARSEDLLAQVQHSIREEGGQAEISVCDLSFSDKAEESIRRVVEKLGGVDALINNAGVVIRNSVWDLSVEDWHAMVATNLNGLFYATRTVLPFMKDQGHGHIINLSSISGHTPLAGGSGYAATKYAVTGFSESLFLEVRDAGIKVTTIFPGSVDSQSHRHNPSEETSWKVQPEEIGEACHQILSTRQGNLISKLEIRPLRKPA
jgi:NADP-dependent 3-hydroxy acid dehydrogenase YdfG